jgi:hypothetical protein
MRRLTTMLYVAALASSAYMAVRPASAKEIGTTVAVSNIVTAQLSTERRNLALGDGVRQNELIEAERDARSEFRLADDTKLALGPGARMVLDRFVYDPDEKSGNIAIDLIKGAFRFMTGVASKPSYVVRVPSASITVRGTVFDVFVQDNGQSWVLLHEGGVKVCNPRGTCRVLDEPGKIILVNDEGDIGVPVRWAGLNGLQGFDFDTAFPFVARPPSIDPSPNFTREALLQHTPTDAKRKRAARKAELQTNTAKTIGSSIKTGERSNPPRLAKVSQPARHAELERIPPNKIKWPKRDKGRIDRTNSSSNLATAKPPRLEAPERDGADLKVTGQDWKRFAEDTAAIWIERVRQRRNRTDANDDVTPGTIPKMPKLNSRNRLSKVD